MIPEFTQQLADLTSQLSEVVERATDSELEAVVSALAAVDLRARRRHLLGAGSSVPEPNSHEDMVIDVTAAAQKLGVSPDWLYRRSRQLPFVVRNGRKLGFSMLGIERYIRQRVRMGQSP